MNIFITTFTLVGVLAARAAAGIYGAALRDGVRFQRDLADELAKRFAQSPSPPQSGPGQLRPRHQGQEA